MARRKRKRSPDDAPVASAPARLRDKPAWEQPPPVEVLALLERFPKPSRNELLVRHAMMAAVAAIALYGILARGWSAQALLVFFAFELATIWALNWLTLALLPVALRDQDRTVIRAWIWIVGCSALILIAYLAVEGRPAWDALRSGVASNLRALWQYLGTEELRWPIACVVAVHVLDLLHDIAHWKRRGGEFRYWAGISFLFRLWFCISIGVFVAFFAWLFLHGMAKERTAALVLWLVFSLADLFAAWMPIWLRRKAERQGAIRAS